MGNGQSALDHATALDDPNNVPPLDDKTALALASRFDFTVAEIHYVHLSHARITWLAERDDWLARRTLRILFDAPAIKLEDMLSLAQWWHSAPATAKIQVIFGFLDVDGDEAISIPDLVTALSHLLGSSAKFEEGNEAVCMEKRLVGTVRYIGKIAEKDDGLIWLGLELKLPVGNTNGTLKKSKYFECAPKYGLFMPVSKCEQKSTYDWINAIFSSVHGKYPLLFTETGNVKPVDKAPTRITSAQFARAVGESDDVTAKFGQWFFPIPLRMGEPVPQTTRSGSAAT
ncbi:CAP Gly-rich domain-containing protein [Blastocladiella britannica]|nr:CAP Gly-rich domain-containing protein [Blastocladiella britannica]